MEALAPAEPGAPDIAPLRLLPVAEPSPALKPISLKHANFVIEYLKDFNGQAAAIRAGFAPARAALRAHRILNRPEVAKELERRLAARGRRAELNAEDVIRELAIIAQADPNDYEVDPESGKVQLAEGAPESLRRAVAAVRRVRRVSAETGEITYTQELRFWPKLAALELIGRQLGMFARRHQLGGDPRGVPIPVAAQVRVYLPDNGRQAAPAEKSA